MTDQRIHQLAFGCFWACETNGTITTNFPRVVTPAIIEEAIKTALKEAAAPEAMALNAMGLPQTKLYAEKFTVAGLLVFVDHTLPPGVVELRAGPSGHVLGKIINAGQIMNIERDK